MLVSLNKNPWLWDWIYETVDPDNTIHQYFVMSFAKTRPEEIKISMAKKLTEKGYKIKITSGKDVIVIMTEEEFTFLKLKYQ
jgi:hypothetical protein